MDDFWGWKKRFDLAERALGKASMALGNEQGELRGLERGRRVPFAKELIERLSTAEQKRRQAFDAWLLVCAEPVNPSDQRS